MGGCVSTSSHSTCSSQSNGESVSSSCMGIGFVCRKRTKRTFSDHVYALQNLPSAPNRIFMNGKSRSSCIFTQQGRKGINQDAMVVWEVCSVSVLPQIVSCMKLLFIEVRASLFFFFLQDFMSEDTIFCGVFDGHGPYGHLVARKVRDTLPIKLLSFFQSPQLKQNDSGKTCFQRNLKTPPDCEDSEKDGFVEDSQNSVWKDAFLNSYKAMDKELRSHPNLDCFCSGSTAVTIVKQVWEKGFPFQSFRFLLSSLFLFSCVFRGQISSWGILGIQEQSSLRRTPMIPLWQFN